MELLGAYWKDFQESSYLRIFFPRKSVEKIQLSLKSGMNKVYFEWKPMNVYDNISLNSS